MDNIHTLLTQAITLLEGGRVTDAEAAFRSILELSPTSADAHHLLGVIAIRRGQYDLAVEFISRAIELHPGCSMFYNNLGFALYMQGRLEEALYASQQAIQLNPNMPEAFFNCGNVLYGLGQSEKALAAYDEAVRLNPDYADAHLKRGNLLLAAGRAEEAEDSYVRVVRLNPSDAFAYNNLAVVLVEQKNFDKALVACDQAIRLNPEYANAHTCLANILLKLHRPVEGLSACDRALSIDPEYVDAHYVRGNILLAIGYTGEAERSYRRASVLSSGNAHLHSNVLFVQAARACTAHDAMLEELRRWDIVHGREGRAKSLQTKIPQAIYNRRLRVGYVSPHLRSSVVSFFFEPLLASHDKSQFEIFCYASFADGRTDAVTERLRRLAEHWRQVGDKTDEELARLIHEDGVDILVDLAGHTSGNRLKAFTYRPAPVQATYLGFFASTGLDAIDYWITDEVLHPMNTRELAHEEIYRLPRCWVCYKPPELAPAVAPCPNSDARVVFGAFQNLSKLTAEVIGTWSQLLQALPGSRLLIMTKYIDDLQTRGILVKKFSLHGIAEDQLILRKHTSYPNYFSAFSQVDIVLDSFPRTGGTTTAEALWMGVPVVTLAGQRYVERISASKLVAVGLQDLIAYTREEYIEKAFSLACDPGRRMKLRQSLRECMFRSPLCDREGLARAMESAYNAMWNRLLTTFSDESTSDRR